MRRATGDHGARGAGAALDMVRARLGDATVGEARFLATPGGKKNVVIRFRVGDDLRVLKVFQHSRRYALRLLTNPLSRWATRAFTLRGTVRQRIAAELQRIESFRSAGLPTFELLGRPDAESLVYAFCPGRDVRTYVERNPESARALTLRIAGELAHRQRLAQERRDVGLVHPQPRLNHVWRTRDGRLVYFDFEDRINPSLPLEEALALEIESFFRDLVRFEPTADPEIVAAAAERLAGASFERWRAISRRPRRFSGSARRRRGVADAVAVACSRAAGAAAARAQAKASS